MGYAEIVSQDSHEYLIRSGSPGTVSRQTSLIIIQLFIFW